MEASEKESQEKAWDDDNVKRCDPFERGMGNHTEEHTIILKALYFTLRRIEEKLSPRTVKGVTPSPPTRNLHTNLEKGLW